VKKITSIESGVTMLKKMFPRVLLASALLASGFWMGRTTQGHADAKNKVFEMRTYTANDGKLEALQARFRNHTTKLFKKHGMTNIGYWTPVDEPLSRNTLVYILAHSNREAAKKSWDGFRSDPDWKKAAQESEVNGKLVSKVDTLFLEPTDYSPMK
jgi:NIPSNAP protein